MAIVVSESAVVRVFEAGELIADIIPELWLFRRHLQSHVRGPVTEEHVDDLAIFTAEEREIPAGESHTDRTVAVADGFAATDPPRDRIRRGGEREQTLRAELRW